MTEQRYSDECPECLPLRIVHVGGRHDFRPHPIWNLRYKLGRLFGSPSLVRQTWWGRVESDARPPYSWWMRVRHGWLSGTQ